jgi:hypothetical protein
VYYNNLMTISITCQSQSYAMSVNGVDSMECPVPSCATSETTTTRIG